MTVNEAFHKEWRRERLQEIASCIVAGLLALNVLVLTTLVALTAIETLQ